MIENNYKEASFYEICNNYVKCTLCPHKCAIKPSESGFCKVRTNIDGKLYSKTYNYPTAINIDPIEKKPLYHFYPSSKVFSLGTLGCNLSCLNCQNSDISQDFNFNQNLKNYTPKQIIQNCLENEIHFIAYTYNEPSVFYEYMIEIAELAKVNNIKNILISNGFINQKPLNTLLNYIDAANIDLKVFDTKIYKALCSGNLEKILETIVTLSKNNIWLEVTNLIIPNWTDDLDLIKKMCNWFANNNLINVPLHFSRFAPRFKLLNHSFTPINIMVQAYNIAKESGINYVYLGNVNSSLFNNTTCPNCKSTLIERQGYSIRKHNIVDNKCHFCNSTIAGCW